MYLSNQQNKMVYLKNVTGVFILFLILAISIVSCTTVNLYEKNIALPEHAWSSSNKPEFTFQISDPESLYQLYFIIRHTEKYNYNNIWINLYSQPPGDTLHKASFECRLANNNKWLGTGIDDIYEHRIKLTNPVSLKAGEYHFSLENIMREDPLEHILNIGLRLEKVE